jgi:Ring finger domain
MDLTAAYSSSSSSSSSDGEATGESPPDIESGVFNDSEDDEPPGEQDSIACEPTSDANDEMAPEEGRQTTPKPQQQTYSPPSIEPSSNDEPKRDAMEQGQEPTACAECSTDGQAPPIQKETVVDTPVLACLDDLGAMSDHPTGYLVLRPGNARRPPKNNPRMVHNCCAVCLGEYEIDDIVVWSCNQECKHAFHQECILEWLNKVQDGGTPCPCCRQEFTDWETQRQLRKIKWAADKAFDVNALRLT